MSASRHGIRLDRRTRAGRLFKSTERQLLADLGEAPTTAETLLANRAASLQVLLSSIENQASWQGLQPKEVREYIDASEALVSTLALLSDLKVDGGAG
jgi:hypothetical protein